MTRRTRLFVLVASAILIAGIGTAGLASYVGIGNFGLAGAEAADELAFVPADAQLVAFVDIRHVMDSELRHKLQPDLASTGAASKFFAETGINIETDVESVLMAAFSESGPAAANNAPLVIARGRFDSARIEASLLGRGGTASDHKGVRLVTAGRDMSVAFIKDDMLALGAPAALQAALDARVSGAATIKDNADVMRLIDRVDDQDAWTVARFDALRSRAPVPADVAAQLPSITWFAAGGRVNDGVSAILHAETRDEQSAQDLREVIRGFVALVRMQVGKQPEFADLMNSIQLSGEGTTVTLGFSVPAAMIDRLNAIRTQPVTPAPRPTPARLITPSI